MLENLPCPLPNRSIGKQVRQRHLVGRLDPTRVLFWTVIRRSNRIRQETLPSSVFRDFALDECNGLELENAAEIVMEMSIAVTIVNKLLQLVHQCDQCFLNDIIRINLRITASEKGLHHRAVSADKLLPADMLRIRGKITKKCRRSIGCRRHSVCSITKKRSAN